MLFKIIIIIIFYLIGMICTSTRQNLISLHETFQILGPSE